MISVIICTHNPRADYLNRTLDGLRAQDLPQDQWQLFVIDNNSEVPLAQRLDLGWHKQGRVLREETPGLTPARLRGMKEAAGDLLIFVDDDNVLAPDYLTAALKLFADRPDLGAASGAMIPEYESPPPAWLTGDRESWIAVRRLRESRWSNFIDSRSEPAGAGLVLRATVAQAYVRDVASSPLQKILDRRGTNLLSGGDVAIVKSAVKAGYTVGQFTRLKLTHLIPTRRVQPEYLFSLYRHLVATGDILGWLDDPTQPPRGFSLRDALADLYRSIFRGSLERRLVREKRAGWELARQMILAAKTQL